MLRYSYPHLINKSVFDMNSQDYPHKNPKITIIDMIRELQETSGVAVNVIESDERFEIIRSTVSQDVAATLDAIVAQNKNYRWCTIMNHYVLYPEDYVWDQKISGIAIIDMSRLDAATQYVTEIQKQVSALSDLVGIPIKGDPQASVYTELVSLHPVASIIEHLVELLGTNNNLTFTIEQAPSGKRVLYFQQVRTEWH